MITLLTVFHVVVCILLVVVVLLQFGKGAELGTISGGASQQIFSSAAKGNVMTKATTILAVLFMLNSILLTVLTSKESKKSLLDDEGINVTRPLNSDAADKNKAPTPTENSSEASQP